MKRPGEPESRTLIQRLAPAAVVALVLWGVVSVVAGGSVLAWVAVGACVLAALVVVYLVARAASRSTAREAGR
ncbi:hypothetical protein [uncultured Pseudokineococcus sp.]|uniref:hypothetical protein n=1 Tax=uncultured Pseudokineococcus sp. TaxID=1642928 RepID=UPI002623AFCB|nr:hypothetical protein [uncultured Pseudokineococcus sp.]